MCFETIRSALLRFGDLPDVSLRTQMRRVVLKRVKIPDSRLMLGPLPKKRIFQNLLGSEPVAERLRDFAAVPFADEEGTVPPAWEGSRAILSLAKLDFVWGPPVTSGCSCSFTAVRSDDRASRLRCRDDLGVRRDGCRRSAVGACMIVGAKETACISPLSVGKTVPCCVLAMSSQRRNTAFMTHSQSCSGR